MHHPVGTGRTLPVISVVHVLAAWFCIFMAAGRRGRYSGSSRQLAAGHVDIVNGPSMVLVHVSRMPWRRDVKQTPWTLDVERNTLPKILALVAPMPVAVHISMMQKHFSQNRFNACSWQAMTGLPCSCWLKICTSCQCLWCIRRPMRHISQLQKSKNCALSVYLGRQYCSSTD